MTGKIQSLFQFKMFYDTQTKLEYNELHGTIKKYSF